MKEYYVKIVATVNISAEVYVEAKSKEEAEKIAEESYDVISTFLVDERVCEIEYIEVHDVKETI